MKHNLTTFPLNVMFEVFEVMPEPALQERYLNTCNLKSFIRDTLMWKEAFEAELREELAICDLGIEYCDKCQKIQEILGEVDPDDNAQS